MNATLSTQFAKVTDRRAGQNIPESTTTKPWPKLPSPTPHGFFCRRYGWTFHRTRDETLQKFKTFCDSPQPIVRHPIYFRDAAGETRPDKSITDLVAELGLIGLHEIQLPKLDALLLLSDREFFRSKLDSPAKLGVPPPIVIDPPVYDVI